MEKYKEMLLKQIEIEKKKAIKEIQDGNMIPAMWAVSSLIDLKAQLGTLERIEDNK